MKTEDFSNFIGKNTDDNLVKTAPEFLTVAKNVICQGDDTIKKCPGYTLVKTLSGKTVRIFDWQRSSDKQQFILVQHEAKLDAIKADGSGSPVTLGSSEDPAFPFDFVTNYFAAYANNGKSAYKIVDKAGTLTKYQWGISAPGSAPGLTIGAGTLNLKYGRQYVRCFVSYITDSTGIQRMHIGPPSPISAHSGPVINGVVTLSGLTASSDPQVTHQWIFETVDTPFNTSSVYYFAAEITNATSSWGDSLPDSGLDTTRQAPWDNKPIPLGSIVVTYQNRAVIIDPDTGNIYFTGFEEIDLGIPMETQPSSLFFQIPSGIRKPTGAVVVDDGNTLLIGTEEAWYKINGYNAATFTEKDRVVAPGPVGKKAITRTPTHLIWTSRDKRHWAWDTRIMAVTGTPAFPIEFSFNIQQKLAGTYSMEDLKDSQLSNFELQWFTYGKHHYVICAGNTSDEPTTALNWVQLWYINYKDGTIESIGETDFIPSDLFSTCAPVLVGSTPYLFFGDASTGAIYRWPDGFQHNGAAYKPMAGTAWSMLDFEGKKRMFWADFITDRSDAKDTFAVSAAVSTTPNQTIAPTSLPIQQIPEDAKPDPMGFRANMQVDGASFGRFVRLLIAFPDDNNQATLKKILVSHKPIFSTAP